MHTAKVMFSEFLSFYSQVGGGCPGKCTIWLMSHLANVPGIEHILAIKVHMPVGRVGGGWGGGGRSGQMHYLANVPGIEHILAIKMPMPMGREGGGVWAYALFGINHFLAKETPPPTPRDEHFLAYQSEVCNRY